MTSDRSINELGKTNLMCTTVSVQTSSRMWRPDGCARAAEVPTVDNVFRTTHCSPYTYRARLEARLSHKAESRGEVAERLKAAVC